MEIYSCLVVLCAVFGVLVNFSESQSVHVVGDEMGWDIPSNSSLSYPNWVSGRTFRVGDILVFNFVTNQHDVLQVPQASYTACTQSNPIGNIITAGPANITLEATGDHYYICTFGRHCNAGQRLAITVVSSSDPPTTAPPETPSPASTQPEACAPDAGGPASAMSPTPPSISSISTSLASGLLLIAVSAGIALIL